MNGQLELFAEASVPRPLNREQAGFVHKMPPGAERLLAALVKRGLDAADLRAAAELCLALDEKADG